jgi:hypothetical protein
MPNPESDQWNSVDLPLLRDLVELFDHYGGFLLRQEAVRSAAGLSPMDFAFAAKRLADAGRIEAQYRAGGFVHAVSGIPEQTRQMVSARLVDASVPRLDALDDALQALLVQVASALQAEPHHPKAAAWRAFLKAGMDVGTDLTVKSVGEITKALLAGRP